MARPSTFNETTFAAILERVSAGEVLATVCKEAGMPPLSTFYGWLQNGGEVAVRFARARESGFDTLASECISIADASTPITAQVDKLRCEMRLKVLAKWDPRYSDTVQVRHAGHQGEKLPDFSESEAVARVAALIEAVRRRVRLSDGMEPMPGAEPLAQLTDMTGD